MDKTLLVCAQGRDKLKQWLADLQQRDVTAVASASEARRSAGFYSLVLINAPLPDETGFELAVELAKRTDSAVILLVKADLLDMINDAATDAGVLLVSKPVMPRLFEQTLRVGFACRNRMLLYKSENERLQKKYEELKVIDRAKCLLIERMRITEEEAHRVIEKEAMDARLPRVRVAKQVIERFEL